MYPAKRAAAALTIAIAATLVSVACAFAQSGAGGYVGGNMLRPAVEESGSLSSVGLKSRQLALPASWQGMLSSFVASRYANSFIARTTVTTRTAVKR